MKYIVKFLLIILSIGVLSCGEDFLDQVPSNQQSPESIKIVSDAQVVLNGAYDLMQSTSYYNSTIITRNDVRADDMQTAEYGRIDDEYLYEYDTDQFSNSVWEQPFRILRQVNSIINFIDDIKTSSDSDIELRDEIKGQAYAIRALAHFDLCKMFGLPYSHNGGTSLGIPLVTKVLNPQDELERNTVAEVYNQIISDLNTAIPLLSEDKSLTEMNAWAAKTLLARTYLYMEDNENAYNTAVDVINNSPYSLMTRDEYIDSWSEDESSESIFSIVNSLEDDAGLESVANLSDPGGYGQFIATQDFIDLMAADPNDIRRELLYIDQVSDPADTSTWGRVLKYPGKGNTKAIIVAHEESGTGLAAASYTSNVPVFRLSEVYLIAAEAAVKEAAINNSNAQLYLNEIVERANPAATVALADVSLDRILLERRKEFVAEGHRFFDLIRNKRDIVRSESERVFDTSTPLLIEYDNYQVVFPIPRDELNVSGMTQNPGYAD